MKKKILLPAVFLVLAVLFTSCRYYCASMMPREVRTGGLALGNVQNLTHESMFGDYMRNAFAREVIRTPGLRLWKVEEAEYLIDLKIVSMSTSSLASAEIREGVDDDDDDTAYQTILHEESLNVEYAVYKKTDPVKKLKEGKVKGSVAMPAMHDWNVMLRSGNQKVAADAARRIVNELTENWNGLPNR